MYNNFIKHMFSVFKKNHTQIVNQNHIDCLKKSRLLSPKIRSIQLHPRISFHLQKMKMMELDVQDNVPIHQDKSNQTFSALAMGLTLEEVILTTKHKKTHFLITGQINLALARLHMKDTDQIKVLALENTEESIVDRLFVSEKLINPIIKQNLSESDLRRVWDYKKYFEKNGLLKIFGLENLPISAWANTLNCDSRQLK